MLSINCTPSTLVSISSSSSLLSAKRCSMSVHQSVQEYDLLSWQITISYTGGTFSRAAVGYPSNKTPNYGVYQLLSFESVY